MLRVTMFGKTELHYRGALVASRASPHVLSLLAYLLLHRASMQRRSSVASALWPDESDGEALSYLRRFLFELQSALPKDPATPWILADRLTIQWNPNARVWLDVAEFERCARSPSTAATACDIYTADLLPHLDGEWILAPRARLAEKYESLSIDLIDRERAKGDHRKALRYATRLVAHDPLREDVVRTIIDIRNALGDRAGALRSYREFSDRLWEELHVEPMPETQAARDRVVTLVGRYGSAVATIDRIDDDGLDEFWSQVKPRVAGAHCVAEAASHLIDALYTRFTSSLVLARAFGTIEAQRLPLEERPFIERSVARLDSNDDVDATTQILTLLASRGIEEAWNDRKRSRDHRAIPLISKQQIAKSPMISRLLEEIGFTAEWRESNEGFAMKTFSNVSGIFYVADAARALDDQGRNVIPATDFVQKYAVATVFGFGGLYVGRHMSISVVLFCNNVVARRQAMTFVPLLEAFKDVTKHLVNHGAIFTSISDPALLP